MKRKNLLMLGSVLLSLVGVSTAFADQIIPTGVEYTTDSIEQGGQLKACMIVAAIISPPAPEIVNFQLFSAAQRTGFKVTAGDVDWKTSAMSAKRLSTAMFSSSQFNHPKAFDLSSTPEGQIIGVLSDAKLLAAFYQAFMGGGYSIQFRRSDKSADTVYYVKQPISRTIFNELKSCVDRLPP